MESARRQNKSGRHTLSSMHPLHKAGDVLEKRKVYKIFLFVYMIGNYIKSLIPITKIE